MSVTNQLEGRGVGTTPKPEEENKPKKLGGVYWWLLLGLMIMSDIGSVFCQLLVTAGLGIAGSTGIITLGIGAALGFGIAAAGWAAGALVSFNAFMFAMGYYFFNKVSLMGARKLATIGASAIIELLPLIGLLPMLTISFLVITFVENAKRGAGGGIIGTVAKKALAKTPIGAVAGKVLSKA